MGMDPVSLSAMSLVAGTVLSGIRSGQEADAQAKTARRQAEAAAETANHKAAALKRQADQERAQAQADNRRRAAAARVGAVDSGIDLGSGSPLEVLTSAAAQDALTLSHIGQDAQQRADAIRNAGLTQANTYARQASDARRKSKTAMLDAGLGLGGSIMGLGARGMY